MKNKPKFPLCSKYLLGWVYSKANVEPPSMVKTKDVEQALSKAEKELDEMIEDFSDECTRTTMLGSALKNIKEENQKLKRLRKDDLKTYNKALSFFAKKEEKLKAEIKALKKAGARNGKQ